MFSFVPWDRPLPPPVSGHLARFGEGLAGCNARDCATEQPASIEGGAIRADRGTGNQLCAQHQAIHGCECDCGNPHFFVGGVGDWGDVGGWGSWGVWEAIEGRSMVREREWGGIGGVEQTEALYECVCGPQNPQFF